eukprot:2122716-Rhodomonas_salina.2
MGGVLCQAEVRAKKETLVVRGVSAPLSPTYTPNLHLPVLTYVPTCTTTYWLVAREALSSTEASPTMHYPVQTHARTCIV